jgi:four helix bundle protein
MAFDAYDRSLDLLRALAPLFARLLASDRELEDQLRRSAQSVLLNIAEANRRIGKDRANRFRCVLGEAAEVTAALDAAVALGYLAPAEVAEPLELADRVRAITFKLAKKG